MRLVSSPPVAGAGDPPARAGRAPPDHAPEEAPAVGAHGGGVAELPATPPALDGDGGPAAGTDLTPHLDGCARQAGDHQLRLVRRVRGLLAAAAVGREPQAAVELIAERDVVQLVLTHHLHLGVAVGEAIGLVDVLGLLPGADRRPSIRRPGLEAKLGYVDAPAATPDPLAPNRVGRQPVQPRHVGDGKRPGVARPADRLAIGTEVVRVDGEAGAVEPAALAARGPLGPAPVGLAGGIEAQSGIQERQRVADRRHLAHQDAVAPPAVISGDRLVAGLEQLAVVQPRRARAWSHPLA